MKINNKNFKSILLLIQPFVFGYLSTIISDYFFGAKGSFKYSAGYLKLKSLYSFVPKPYLFGIVWPILYILMGIAILRVYRKKIDTKDKNISLLLNQLQILLCFIWTPTYLYNIFYSFIIILILNILVWILIYYYYKVDKIAFILMLPYTFWLMFATLLNYLSL